MEPSPDAKSAPSSPEATKDSASTPKLTGSKLNAWRGSIPRHYRQYSWPAYRQLLKRSKRPILVGPFLGEVGLEILYWQPFVDRLRHELGIDPSRLIPISRSGAQYWYGCPTGIEVFAMRTPQDVRVENKVRVAKTGLLKQLTVTDFDRAIWRDTAASLGISRYLTLHPSWMYQTLEPFWLGERGFKWVDRRLRFAPLPYPELGATLPDKFIAMKFYARPTWPADPTTAAIGRETMAQVAKMLPVVLLNTGLVMDDHVDFVPKPLPANVSQLSDLIPMDPQHSLAAVSYAMAKATAYVGTYGGLGHLALRYQKPSLNLYTEWQGASVAHKHLSEALAVQARVPYLVLRLNDVPMIQDCLPKVAAQSAPPQKVLAPA